jgi:dTDP-4-dehydrorhamnose 3,5-epimerase-like enzyme
MAGIRVVRHARITTRDPDGIVNGSLISFWNIHEPRLPADRAPEQLYVTICAPRARKGPHLHRRRWGYFTCIRGNVRIVIRTEHGYEVAHTGEDHEFATVEVPAGCAALIENLGDTDAYVINMPSPAWRADDPDEHPVDNWDFRD